MLLITEHSGSNLSGCNFQPVSKFSESCLHDQNIISASFVLFACWSLSSDSNGRIRRMCCSVLICKLSSKCWQRVGGIQCAHAHSATYKATWSGQNNYLMCRQIMQQNIFSQIKTNKCFCIQYTSLFYRNTCAKHLMCNREKKRKEDTLPSSEVSAVRPVNTVSVYK